jgi:hypothetical protein
MVVLVIFLQACGGGGSTSVVPRTQKTATVEFAVSTTNTDASAVTKGVTMVVRLPAGVSVTTDEPGSTLITKALVGVNNFWIPAPTYTAANNEITIDAPNVSNTNANVVFARLTCEVIPGNTLDAAQFSAIMPTVFDPRGTGGSDLKLVTPPVLPKISATFGY